jgi:hypothetical protein
VHFIREDSISLAKERIQNFDYVGAVLGQATFSSTVRNQLVERNLKKEKKKNSRTNNQVLGKWVLVYFLSYPKGIGCAHIYIRRTKN